ncbi:MAG TPA: porin [Chromatiaceae bacterium]|nr:porin [Chromatiaceae bacterium]
MPPITRFFLLIVAILALTSQPLRAEVLFYGKVNVALVYADQGTGEPPAGDQVTRYRGFGLNDNKAVRPWVLNPFITTPRGPANRFGLEGSSDLGAGLKALFKVELGLSLADSNNEAFNLRASETLTMRNTFLGLGGTWGRLLLGRQDTPFKSSTAPLDLFINTLGDSASTLGFQNYRADNSIYYGSPSLAGLKWSVALLPGGGATLPGGFNVAADRLTAALSLAATYARGPLYASLAFETVDADLADPGTYPAVAPWRKWRLGLGLLDWQGLSVTGMFEHWDHAFWGADHRADLWQLQLGYRLDRFQIKAKLGGNQQRGDYALLAPVGQDLMAEDDFAFHSWALGGDYAFSRQTKLFLVYSANLADPLVQATSRTTHDVLDWRGVQLGISHAF